MYKMLALAIKEVRLRFSHPLSIAFFVILPVILTAVLGAGMGTLLPDAQDPRSLVAVVDDDGGLLAAELLTALHASPALDLQPLPAGRAREALLGNDVAAVVHIPAGFTPRLLAGQTAEVLLQTAIDNRAPAIQQAVQATIAQVGSLVAASQASVAEVERLAPFATETEKQAYFEETLVMAHESLVAPAAIVKTNQAEQQRRHAAGGFAQSSPGQLVAWTLLTFLQGATSLVDERASGTLRRLVIMPIAKPTILGGKLLGRCVLGLIQMTILILVGWALFRVDWGRDSLALTLIALSFALASTSLGLMVSTFLRTRAQAASASIGLALLLSTLGSCWWPMDISPPAYQTFIKIFPTTWAVLGFTDVITRGYGVAEVWSTAAMLLLFAVVFFAIGIWRFRYE